MIKEKNLCVTDNCFNDREYEDKITYWVDKWGNERFNAPVLELCVFCRIAKEKESE